MSGFLQGRTWLLLLLAAAIGLSACGDDAADGDTPSESEIPASAVALVGDRPVARSDYDRLLRSLRRSAASTQSAGQLQQQAMTLLLQEAALEQEARKRGIDVPASEVRGRLAHAKKQFRDKRQYKQFLGRQTEADLLFQLRLQTLTEKINKQIAESGGNLKKFMSDFPKRSRERTVCRDGYVTASCANADAASG